VSSAAFASADILVVGGGLGGVAAALAALRRGHAVIMTEETDWLGGQLTAQGVPPDEHAWIEQFGCTRTYRELREAIRDHYRRWYPLTTAARRQRDLNPGQGRVSRLTHEPHVAAVVLESLIGPYTAAGRLRVFRGHRPVAAEVDGDRIASVTTRGRDGRTLTVEAPYVLDATELGDLLPLTGAEHVTGSEAATATGEPSAPEHARPDNVQAFSWVFAVDHREGEDHTIDRPADYGYWSAYQPPFWPDRMLSLVAPDPRTLEIVPRTFVPNRSDVPVIADQSKDPGDKDLWVFRRILARQTFEPGYADSDITLVNWPMIDYLDGSLLGDAADVERHLRASRRQSLSMLYWLQTEAPRPDGGTGWPGLRLRGDVLGTDDGFAKAPYIRESRRIRAERTVVEQDLSLAVRNGHGAERYDDTVGIGMYRIDLHPSTGGDNYLDIATLPFQIPLGALIPVRLTNLLPASKNIGTTHITNGCYRLHPVEWNIGEAAGALASYCLDHRMPPTAVRATEPHLRALQEGLAADGVELEWPQVKGY
jgi:hypothetical protein